MAEIKIRNLDEGVIKKIDKLAEKKGISRNEYLKAQMELLVLAPVILEQQDKYSILINKITKVLEYNTLALNKFLEENLIDLDEAVSSKEF